MIPGGFRARIAVSFLALLASVQVAVLVAVHAANTRSARGQIADQLVVAGRVFDRLIETRNQQLAEASRLLARDFGFATAVATGDHRTVLSAMQNHRNRMKASVMMLASLDGVLVADTLRGRPAGARFPFPELLERAGQRGQALAFVDMEGGLYQAAVVPVLAPVPAGWVLMGLRIDDAFAADLQRLTSTHVTFLTRRQVVASTLTVDLRAGIPEVVTPSRDTVDSLHLGGGEYVTLARAVPGREGDVVAVLQRPLTEVLQPFRRLELTLVALFLGGLVVSVVAGLRIARTVGRPLEVLAEGARRIEHGDYAHRVELGQEDELGRLAAAFNNMAHGISEREEQLKHQAYHDGLTGLPNRALFQHMLEQAIASARREKRQLGILLLDLDRFKDVNDTLGHNIGDLILQQVGPRLTAAVREADTVARLGGDECAVLLRALGDPRDALDVVHRIHRALEEPFTVEGQPIDLSASVGVAFYPDHGEDPTTLVRHADVAMYVAKRSAAGFAVYDPEMDQNSPRRLALVGELRRAIDEGGLVLHYQPKVDLRSGRTTDVEALLRWEHPQHGVIAPSEFIPLAEQTGLVGPLTLWVLEEALGQWTAWRGMGIQLGVAVNLSARVLQDESFPERVSALLARSAVPPAVLVLEITESAIMADPACAMRVVKRLDALGVRLSVDDFGTGYSSLTYLKDLPLDELKIDKSFVMDLDVKSNEVIVRATIDLAHNLEITVTAEGVETLEACERLKAHRCDQAQGYFISRPLPAAELTPWLKRGAADAPSSDALTVPRGQ
ncbi:MAG: putative bifunctional diguanylate cyclase/phosphodiesterase [Candidatus Rokuibacteriota bacterium]